MGGEEEQNLMGRRNRGLREDRGVRRTSHESGRPQPFPRNLRSSLRPVLPWLQPDGIAWEKLKPRTHRCTLQS